MKKQIAVSLWLLLNLVGAYLSLKMRLPSFLPYMLMAANALLFLVSYSFGWMGAGIVASCFYSVMTWVGAQAFAQWGYTKWVAYPMYVFGGMMSLVFFIYRRRFVRLETTVWVERLMKKIKKQPEINALHFSLGEEDIDCEYPNSK